MLTIRIEQRSYYLHRPDGCTTLLIQRDYWPGNEFGLWLPEAIFFKEGTPWCNFNERDRIQEWSTTADGGYSWTYSHERFRLISSITFDPKTDCLWYTHQFTNTSDASLESIRTTTCFHLVNAPQFISIRGERYWACLDGKWTTTDTVPRQESPDPNRVRFDRKGLNPERKVRPRADFLMATLPQEAYHPLFIAESFDRGSSVGIACRPFKMLFNNNDYILRCLHSEPFRFEQIPPGESATQEGIILFCDGDRTTMIDLFEYVTRDKPAWIADKI